MAIVKKHTARVKSIRNPIEGVYAVEFESLDKPFKYAPGQFMHLALDEYDPAGQWPDSRCFSMQSSPDEGQIKITYAVKGQFTKRMQRELKTGSKVTLKLPYGDLFTQPHNKENAVFIAGGTGITPFLSLFNHSSFSEYMHPVLYAGFRNQAMNVYIGELVTAKKINPHFKLILVYQDKDGILDINEIFQSVNLQSAFFISGPHVMIKTFKQVFLGKGMQSNQVLTDDWE
jgi:predicted ferric reductase